MKVHIDWDEQWPHQSIDRDTGRFLRGDVEMPRLLVWFVWFAAWCDDLAWSICNEYRKAP